MRMCRLWSCSHEISWLSDTPVQVIRDRILRPIEIGIWCFLLSIEQKRFLQKEDTITGHFLICYLSVLLVRIFQIKILENKYCTEEIFDFMKRFKVAKLSEKKYINLTKNTSFIKAFSAFTNLPLTSYFLTDSQLKNMLSYRF